MLVTSSRQPITMGPLASSAPGSPNGHHLSGQSDDEENHNHLPADLSPRSSNSSSLSGESFGNNYSQSPERKEEKKMSPKFSPFYSGGDSEQQLDLSKQFAILGSPQPSGGESDHDMDSFIRPSSVSLQDHAAVIFQCPLCTLVCNSRHDFNEHLVTHSTEHRACPRCAFVATNEDQLRDHISDAHTEEDMELLSDDDEVKTPKTNAQGKLKTFKCKQCEHVAVTKKEFWDHNKTHIRSEKMLHCPKCAFVTEYKHHLEYHLRNHMGSKPYQCTKCNYSCVNKSMLNSHLKSHSNVYQYRCSDCTYATKYCHSLKLHLRKYNHQPAMVLNPDGTPNPLPIIDVYGTRRGPKMKRPDPILEGLATTQPLHMQQQKQPKIKTGPKKSKKAREFSPKPVNSPSYMKMSNTPPLKREDMSSGDSDNEIRSRPQPHHTLPQAPISPTSIAMILQQRSESSRKEYRGQSPNPLDVYNAAISQYLMNPMFHMQNGASLNDILAAQQLAAEQKTKLLATLLQSVPNLPSELRPSFPPSSNGAGVLDLSSGTSDEGRKQSRKRKGKAIRYEPGPSASDTEDEKEEALDFSNNNNSNDYLDKNRKRLAMANLPTDLSRTSPQPQAQPLMCKYCEISFPVAELYAIHMNYHSGDQDPFLCRSCGKQTRNNVEFFKHLATDPH